MLAGGALFAGRFEIDRLAGEGGMGLVYRAWDRERSSWVALKVLHADGVQDKDRFDREARVLSSLSHPGIVEYVAHGIDGDRMYLAMEWLVGHDLEEHMRRSRLGVLDAVAIVERISGALAVAHDQDVVHRDLKPSNLFLVDGDPEKIKILDFGVAKQMASGSIQTKTGAMIGTPGYMAPEQTRGEREIPKSADVFALGCVLYHCLTGQPPFVADHLMAVLVRILFEEPTPVEELQPATPPPLAALMRGALAKDPDRRPHDAETLQLMLRALLDARDETAAPAAPAPRSSFGGSEQSLLSVVLASPVAEAGVGKAIGFLQELRTYGVAAELLANKTLFVSVPVMGSAIDQATLAARCALEIKQRFPSAAVAMATGRGSMRGTAAVGDVADEAARLLARRDKDAAGVLLDGLSAKLLEGRFAQTPHAAGALLLKEEKGVDASRPLLGKSTACVGRDAELATLAAQVASSIDDSEARVVLVTGSPGIGKSRLRHELLRRVDARDEPVTLLLGRGEPTLASEPYGIFGAAIRGLCGIASDMAPADQQRRIEMRVARHVPDMERERVAVFLGEACSVPFDGAGIPMLEDARREPKIMGDRTHRAVLDWLAAETAAAPLLMIFDDVQWSDASTIAVLDEVLREQAARPVCLLAFARPEVHEKFPKLFESHKLLELPVRGLSAKACTRLIKQVLGDGVAANLIDRAVAQCAGNALFLEEIIRALSEGRPDHPETVLAMLQARIQHLDPDARSTLRAASLFGLTAWRGGVARVLGLPKDSSLMAKWLDELVAAELLQPRPRSRLAGEVQYEFRHALVRDATYALLTQSDLATGHVIAADFLAQAGERDYAVIADHYFRAGDLLHAAAAYLRAAEASLEQGDHATTISLFERGLACKPEGEVLGELHAIASYCAFFSSNEAHLDTAGEAALPLVRAGSRGQCRALQGAISSSFFRGDEARALELLPQLLAFEPAGGARVAYIEALCGTSFSLAVVPAPLMEAVIQRLEYAVSLVEDDAPMMRRYLHLARSMATAFRAPAPWTATREGRRAVFLSREAGDVRQEVLVPVLDLEWSWLELGDQEGVETRLGELGERISQRDELTTLNLYRVIHAYALCEAPTPARLARAKLLAEGALTTKAMPFVPMATGALARVALASGDPSGALELAEQAMQTFSFLPLLMAQVGAVQMRALCALGMARHAAAVAEHVLAIGDQIASIGPCDTEVRVAACEAVLGAGDVERAKTLLATTLERMKARVGNIVDPVWKTSYLTRNRHAARALVLASELGVPVTIALEG